MTQRYVKLLTENGYFRFENKVGITFPATRIAIGWMVEGLFFGEDDVEEVFISEDPATLLTLMQEEFKKLNELVHKLETRLQAAIGEKK